MLSGDGNENSQKKSTGLTTKNRPCTCSALLCTFFCFARIQYETSRSFLVTRFMEEMLYVFQFTFHFPAIHFHLGSRQHFSFSHHRNKIFMLFFELNWSPLFFICRFSSFSVINVNMYLKIKSKEKNRLYCCCFFLSPKSPGGYLIYRRNARVLQCRISSRLT